MSTFAIYFKLAGLCYVQSPLTGLLPLCLLQSLSLQLLCLFHQSNTCFNTICVLTAVPTKDVINPDERFLMPLLQVDKQFTNM